MRPNVSIIIPTYNAEAFLVQCLDSVVQQTHQSIEIVIINDASTDSSLDIIKSYQAQDPRITLIDFKENKGNGYGRNFGIKQAQGEYILFLDSDDWLEPDAVEQVYHKALQSHSQVVVFGYTQHMTAIKNKRKNKEIFLPTVKDGGTDFFFYFMMHRKGMYSMPWIYLISKQLLMDHTIEFSVGIYFEDIIFVTKTLHHIQTIGVYSDKPLYHYRIRKNSITQSLSKKKIDDNFTAHVIFKDYLEEVGIFKTYEREYLIRFLVYCVFLSFWDYYRTGKAQRDAELDAYMTAIRQSKLLSVKNLYAIKTAYKGLEQHEKRTKRTYKTASFILHQIKYNLIMFKGFMKIIRYITLRHEKKKT